MLPKNEPFTVSDDGHETAAPTQEASPNAPAELLNAVINELIDSPTDAEDHEIEAAFENAESDSPTDEPDDSDIEYEDTADDEGTGERDELIERAKNEVLGLLRPLTTYDAAAIDMMTDNELRALLAEYRRHLGASELENKAAIQEFIDATLAQPTHQARLRVVHSHMSALVSLAQRLQRTINNSAMVNTLAHDEFTVMAKNAINGLQVLTSRLHQIGNELGVPAATGPEISLNGALLVLQYMIAHLDSMRHLRDSGERALKKATDQVELLRARADHAEKAARDARASVESELTSLRKSPSDLPREWFIIDPDRRLLCTEGNPESDMVRLHELYWSNSYLRAVKFGSKDEALEFVDQALLAIVEAPFASVILGTQEVEIAGVIASAIGTARLGIVSE